MLEIFVTVSDLRHVQVSFDYELRRESDNRLIATARTKHACVDIARLRMAPLPDWAKETLRRLQLPRTPAVP